ncbi:MAG: sugar phosphate nucleotidyltransferase [Veillonella parvula]
MAAGMATRLAPLSYEKPKALLNIKGEILIERQIKQLKEAGIQDITIIVGYRKEMFGYLQKKFELNWLKIQYIKKETIIQVFMWQRKD